jgi:uncharacterized membrane protein (DUF373 family)
MNTEQRTPLDLDEREENAPAPTRPGGDSRRSTWFPRDALRHFEQIEHWISVGIGVLLSLVAVLAFAGAVKIAWDGIVQWPQIRSLFEVVDRLLLVLMIIELLHTVRSSIQSHQLGWEPFLIVAMIATVRRILVITLEISDQTPRSQASAGSGLSFDQAMVELGVLAALMLVIAIAIYLLRRANA